MISVPELEGHEKSFISGELEMAWTDMAERHWS